MTKVNALKKENINQIRARFLEGGIYTKNQLSQLTHLSLAAVTNILIALLHSKEILQIDDADSTGGRKSKQYQINPSYQFIAEVILYKTKEMYCYQAMICGLDGNVVCEKRWSSKKSDNNILQEAIVFLSSVDNVSCLVISIPGICRKGYISVCDFESLQDFSLLEWIQERWNVHVIIENDVNVALIGFSKTCPNQKDIVLLYQPSTDYFGCGIMIGGVLYNGAAHKAGELRYLPDYTEQQQLQLLQSTPKQFLESRIQILQAVLDPEMIGWYSDAFKETEIDISKNNIVHIDAFHPLIEDGLYQIGVRYILEKGGDKYVR